MKIKRPSVAKLVARYAAIKKMDVDAVIGDMAVGVIARVQGEVAGLDLTECLIVEIKRSGSISGSKMVRLLRRHQKECLGRA